MIYILKSGFRNSEFTKQDNFLIFPSFPQFPQELLLLRLFYPFNHSFVLFYTRARGRARKVQSAFQAKQSKQAKRKIFLHYGKNRYIFLKFFWSFSFKKRTRKKVLLVLFLQEKNRDKFFWSFSWKKRTRKGREKKQKIH